MAPEEEQARDAGRRRDDDGELPHRVPPADVDEGDVDDVAAATIDEGEFGPGEGDALGRARPGRDEGDEHHDDARGDRDDGAQHSMMAAVPVTELGREAAQR